MALECGICLDSFPEADAFFLSSCGHSLHHPCLIANVHSRLSDAGDTTVRCPVSGCGIALLDADISLLSDASVLARLHRVRAQRADPSLRFCACGGEVRGGSARAPQLRCGACGGEFCWLHEARHAPGAAACAAFVERERADPANAASLAALRVDSKQCPNAACGSWVAREGGCNSVVCSVCSTTFCWLCGEQIEPGELPIHFQWCAFGAPASRPLPRGGAQQTKQTNPPHAPPKYTGAGNLRSRCRFSQFGAGRARTPLQEAALLVFTLFYGLFFGLPAAILILAVCLALPCCCVPIFLRNENPLTMFATWSGIVSWALACLVFLAVAAPFGVLGGIIVCLLAACGFTLRIGEDGLRGVPSAAAGEVALEDPAPPERPPSPEPPGAPAAEDAVAIEVAGAPPAEGAPRAEAQQAAV